MPVYVPEIHMKALPDAPWIRVGMSPPYESESQAEEVAAMHAKAWLGAAEYRAARLNDESPKVVESSPEPESLSRSDALRMFGKDTDPVLHWRYHTTKQDKVRVWRESWGGDSFEILPASVLKDLESLGYRLVDADLEDCLNEESGAKLAESESCPTLEGGMTFEEVMQDRYERELEKGVEHGI